MKRYLALATACASALILNAKVTLPEYFTSNMVIQQKSTLTIKGVSSNKQAVAITTSWDKKTHTAPVNSDGAFSISVKTPKAGGPHTISFNDGDVTTLSNILSGEVWFCSGQSNMEMPVNGWGKVMNYEEELANANYPQIRLLQSARVIASKPSEKATLTHPEWRECSPQSVDNFSSVAYFFARHLHNTLKVPIGVIDSSWGGTPAETWTSLETLKNVYGLQNQAHDIEAANGSIDALNEFHKRDMLNWQRDYNAADAGMLNGEPRWVNHDQSANGWPTMNLPSTWEDRGMPNFDGCVWFQKTVEIPQNWQGKELTLNLAKIDDDDIVWFNGTKIGQTGGYWIDRSYKVPASLVNAGKAIITVRVQDGSGGGGIYGDANNLNIALNNEKISLAGDWIYQIGAALANLPKQPKAPNHQNYPTNLYNAMVYPFRDFNIKGVIWYQGEENSDRWKQYTPLFHAMIRDWRKLWNTNLPFYFVQLANWQAQKQVQPESTWAHLREAQANALQLENTGMAVAIDIGEAYDIHPKNKQEVGRRLALAALAQTYNKGKYQIPAYTKFRTEGRNAIIEFNQPISIRGDEAVGFVMAGPDMIFHEAKATVKGNVAIVSCDKVDMPVAVRYAWADNPACNLQGNDNLPVAPFRTDSFE